MAEKFLTRRIEQTQKAAWMLSGVILVETMSLTYMHE